MKASFDFMGRITRNGCQFAGAGDVRGGRQGLDFLGGHVWIGGVEIDRVRRCSAVHSTKGVGMIGDRSGRRIVDVLKDRVEHRPGLLGQIGHELG